MVSLFYWLTFVLILINLCYYCSQYKLNYWKRLCVRSLPTHWLFGNLKDAIFMKNSASVVLGQLHLQGSDEDRKDEDILGIYIFWKPFLLIRSPELIKQILVKDFRVFSDRYFATKTKNDIIGTKNLFSIDNPEWKFLRQKMTSVFSTGKIKKFFTLIMENTAEMKNFIDEQIPNDSAVKALCVRDMAKKYGINVISSLAFGIKTNSFGPHTEFYNQSMSITSTNFLATFRLLLVFFFPWLASFAGASVLGGESARYFRKVFWESMNERERLGVKRGDLIDSLLELKNAAQNNQFEFEGDVLLAQSAIFFVAGLESTTVTITFSLYELAKRPDIQDRVRQEISENLRGRDLTYDCLQEMKYLHQVVSEILRMYPPAPIIDRVSSEDYQIPGTKITIKKGTPVYVSLFGLHYDPKYYENPKDFNPDRFSEENKGNIPPYTYMPFGEGPRSCIAMRVGLLQVTAALITILSNYEVSLNPLSKIGLHKRSVFLRTSTDLILNFRKISVNQ